MARRTKAYLQGSGPSSIATILSDTGANYAILPSYVAQIFRDVTDSVIFIPASITNYDGQLFTPLIDQDGVVTRNTDFRAFRLVSNDDGTISVEYADGGVDDAASITFNQRGDKGDAGASLEFRYQTNNSASTPDDPTADASSWSSPPAAPTPVSASARYYWLAMRAGAGAWAVWRQAEYQAPSGGSSSSSSTPTPATHQRYLAYASTAGYSESELTGGTSITSGDTGALSGATSGSFVKVWSAEPLTEITNPVLRNPGQSGNANILTTHFAAAVRHTINGVRGYYYESTSALNVLAVNQTWTVR